MITIIDYGMGNLGSIQNMLKKIQAKSIISADPLNITRADKLILPGVGAFDTGMQNLQKRGLISVLHHLIINKKIPILGICLGMQLFTKKSEEGNLPGLGFIDAETVKFQFSVENVNLKKIPHMGWNSIIKKKEAPLLDDIGPQDRFYFVHSYHVECKDKKNILAAANYGHEFTSIIQKENIFGVQFHPEKSLKYGMKLFKNFVFKV